MKLIKLVNVFFLLVAVTVYATPPKVPEVKMAHKEVFIEKDTNEKRRIWKTVHSMGAQIWDPVKEKFVKHDTFFTFHIGTKSVSEVIHYNKGLKEGSYEWYYENGTLREEGTYKSNMKSGTWIKYTKKGEAHYRKHYKNGELDGKEVTYHLASKDKESIQFIKHYKNGLLDGKWEQYNAEGEKRVWGQYKDGKKHGLWYEYATFGKKIESTQYTNGKANK